MKALLGALCLELFFAVAAFAQGEVDTTQKPFVKGGIYDKPYLIRPSARLAVGGYAEMLVRSDYEAGIHKGYSFEARRFNIFLFSSVSDLVKFTSELEFEHGTEEIKLEIALVDLQFREEFNLRGGILLSPIGKFNLAHDSPRNEFVDRPLVSTRVIPATLSEAGLGFYGSFYPVGENRFTYETYLVNGLTDGLVLAGDGTSLPDGRPEAFEEDNNGSPAFVGRLAFSPQFGGELGISIHSGRYNSYKEEGLEVDEPRTATLLALDAEYEIGRLALQGELARASIVIPPSLVGLFAEKQWGFYGQALYNLFDQVLPMYPQSVLAIGTRYDYIDLDADIVGAHLRRFTFGVNLRPVPETVLKLNYLHNWEFDRINNQTRSAALQFGIATYF
ncbi:MAG: hypothetical protein ACM3YF_06220 [Candidatus Zixiibacteriota bacterium]